MSEGKKVLVLGSGGREHAFVYKFCNDPLVLEVFCSPGNGGTSLIAKNISLDLNNHNEIIKFVQDNNIDLTVVGPENPLADGIVDSFKKYHLTIFGPDAFCAQLESSKVFARDIMAEYNIPHPKYYACKNKQEAIEAKNILGLPIVLKADGLAAGKGVIICESKSEAQTAINDMMVQNKFGNAASVHHIYGREGKEAVENSRKLMAESINGRPRDIIFTSGATESINLAIKGVCKKYQNKGKHVVTQQTEHKAVLDTCASMEKMGWRVTYLPVNSDGIVNPNSVFDAIEKDTVLVTVMHANNEIGTIQPIAEIGAICRQENTFFMVDACQSFGKLDINVNEMNIDLMAATAHKIYGPKESDSCMFVKKIQK